MKTKLIISIMALIAVFGGWYACYTEGGSSVPDKVVKEILA